MRYTPARVKSLPGLALAAVLLAVGAGRAGAQTRPLRTEPAVTAPAGTLVLETGFDVIADEPSYVTGVGRTRWDGPLLRLVYSPARNVELDLEWVTRVGVAGEEGRGDIQSSEWGDVTLRAKWRFVEGKGRRPAVGARFGVVLPQTSFEDVEFNPLGLGPNTVRAFVEGLLTQPVGRARVHVNAGIFLHDEVYRLHDQRDFLSYGLAVEWPVATRLAILAEVAGRAGDGAPGADERSEARAGLRFGRGRLRGDVAVRRGLAEGGRNLGRDGRPGLGGEVREVTASGLASRPRASTALLLAGLAVLLLPGLGSLPITRAEIYFLDAARHMAESGDWLVPRYQGEPFFDKPALAYWAMAAAFRLLGPEPFAARLVSVLAALGVVAATVGMGRRLFDDRTAIAAGACLSTTLAFLSFARIAMSDMLLSLFTTLGAALAARAWDEAAPRSTFPALGACLGLGFLAKGPIALVVGGSALFALAIVHRRLPPVCGGRLAAGVLAFAVTGLGWFAALHARVGPGALEHFFLRENLSRFGGSTYALGQPPWFYLTAYLSGGLPWSLFLPLALWRLRDEADPRARASARTLVSLGRPRPGAPHPLARQDRLLPAAPLPRRVADRGPSLRGRPLATTRPLVGERRPSPGGNGSGGGGPAPPARAGALAARPRGAGPAARRPRGGRRGPRPRRPAARADADGRGPRRKRLGRLLSSSRPSSSRPSRAPSRAPPSWPGWRGRGRCGPVSLSPCAPTPPACGGTCSSTRGCRSSRGAT